MVVVRAPPRLPETHDTNQVEQKSSVSELVQPETGGDAPEIDSVSSYVPQG